MDPSIVGNEISMYLRPGERETIEGLCLDKRLDKLKNRMVIVSRKLGTSRQDIVTILALRQNLVPVEKWRQVHPFDTQRQLNKDEIRLIKAYVDYPTLSDSAKNAWWSRRQSSRIWQQIYGALGVKSRPAALTASYLLGYWE